MDITLASVNNSAYQELANITTSNKTKYAKLYGYHTYFKNSDFKFIPNNELQSSPNNIGWEKIATILEAFYKYPQSKYVWLSDCDSMITNSSIAIEYIISKYANHIIVSCDRDGINTGQIIVKNSPTALLYLDTLLENHSQYRDENQYVIETRGQYRDIISVIPQKSINSYDYGDHQAQRQIIYDSTNDMNGDDGQWRPGDFIIHWAAATLGMRLAMAPLYLDLINDRIDYDTFSKLIKKIRNEV